MVMTFSIILITLLNLLAIYGTVETGIEVMSRHFVLGLILMLVVISIIILIYIISLRTALKKNMKRFLLCTLVFSLVILSVVIFRHQIVMLWNELFITIDGPGDIPNRIELD